MSIIVDQQYAGMIAGFVRNFTRVPAGYKMSCPICGDSATNPSKARGYLYINGDRLQYTCHKCSTPITSLYDFLKQVDGNLAEQYLVDTFAERGEQRRPEPVLKVPEFVAKLDKKLIKVSTLPPGHPTKVYVQSRQIPTSKHYLLYHVDDFAGLCARTDPKVDIDVIHKSEPRLIIPLIAEGGKIAGYQGRSLDPKSPVKYLTVLYHGDNGKLYGLDRYNFNRHGYAFEGPLDSLFIENSIATTGGRIDTILTYQAINRSSITIVYDNEPRSKFTVAKMQKAVDNGFPVCFWPDTIREKDINQMILAGKTAQQLKDIIDNNTYSGLEASLQMGLWRKV